LAKCAGHLVGVRLVKTDRIAAIAVRPMAASSAAGSRDLPAAGPGRGQSIMPDGRPFMVTARRA
jgi:hypothetical protein